MEPTRDILYLLLISVVFPQICSSLDDGSFYHIRNSAENTYIYVESGAVPCTSIGHVSASSSLEPSADSYRWRFNLLAPTTRAYLEINDPDYNGLDLNEVSMYTGGPSCYFSYREMDIIPVSENVYRIKSLYQEECLVSNGVGQRVSWTTCNGNSRNQQWEFRKA
ncbi:unnamed protein product [Orchesella dallaii]|uniref:Ricin B lectin domain-containing protein n=1 Tax=Orchesella dallaii TaxID=48710 RepID=A0ABP1QWD4_9HEXA